MCISGGSSIFTANTKAIDLVLDLCAHYETSNKFVIFSDSVSVLKFLDQMSSKDPKNSKTNIMI